MAAPWTAGFQVRIKGKIHGQDTNTVLHFATNVVINDAPTLNQLLKDLANAVYECVTDLLIPATSSDWTLTNVEALGVHPNLTDPIAADITAVDHIGNLPAQGGTALAQLVQLRTGVGGKSGRGRNFWPPAGEDAATAGEWTPAQLALIAAFCACMAGKFVGGAPSTDFRLGVLSHKKVNDVLPPFDDRFREVTSLVPVATIAYMTSRKVGRGS